MKPISTDLENILQSVQLREDEYLDEESNVTLTYTIVQYGRRYLFAANNFSCGNCREHIT